MTTANRISLPSASTPKPGFGPDGRLARIVPFDAPKNTKSYRAKSTNGSAALIACSKNSKWCSENGL